MSDVTVHKYVTHNELKMGIQQLIQQDIVAFYQILNASRRMEKLFNGCSWLLKYNQKPYLILLYLPPSIYMTSIEDVNTFVVDKAAEILCQHEIDQLHGPEKWVNALTGRLEINLVLDCKVILHRLVGNPILPHAVPGFGRFMKKQEIELLRSWRVQFMHDALPNDPIPSISDEDLMVLSQTCATWEVDGKIVSIAQRKPPQLDGFQITCVYTPPEMRGQGYAGACVFWLCQQSLLDGAKHISLYTDADNRVSNSLYRKIGFVPDQRVNVSLRRMQEQ